MKRVLTVTVILIVARAAAAQPSSPPPPAPASAPAAASAAAPAPASVPAVVPASAPAAAPAGAHVSGSSAKELRFDALRIDGALHGPEAVTIRSDLARQERPLHRLRRSFVRRILRTVESPCLHR